MVSRGFLAFALATATLFTPTTQALYVLDPCCYDFPHVGASFGPKLNWAPRSGYRADLVPLGVDACTPISETMNLKGMIALVSRGDCTFADKVFNLQEAGALAVVIHDNVQTNQLVMMAQDKSDERHINIPAVFISLESGLRLRNELFPSKVDLFRADEAFIQPFLEVPGPILAAFSFLFFVATFLLVGTLVRGCCCMRGRRRCGRRGREGREEVTTYVINSRGFLEPLGASNVVILDASHKADPDSTIRATAIRSTPSSYVPIATVTTESGENVIVIPAETSENLSEPLLQQRQ